MNLPKWLRGIGWQIRLTWHQLTCTWDCGFSSFYNADTKQSAAWCLTCDHTWTRP